MLLMVLSLAHVLSSPHAFVQFSQIIEALAKPLEEEEAYIDSGKSGVTYAEQNSAGLAE
jgi:hypothetical protein